MEITDTFKRKLVENNAEEEFQTLIDKYNIPFDMVFDYNIWYKVDVKKEDTLLVSMSHSKFYSFMYRLELLLTLIEDDLAYLA